MKITVKKDNINERLDKFLQPHLPKFSRSQIQKMIKGGLVLVNDQAPSVHYAVKKDDKVLIKREESKKQAVSEKIKKYFREVKIIDDTNEYLIINKPAGLIVHGGDGIKELTLADYLIKKYSKLKKIGEDPKRPAIVHRLDKDVSGLMIIPKTEDSFASLKKQFQSRKTKKEYAGLVYGAINKDEDHIIFPIERASKGYRMAALPLTSKGRLSGRGRNAITDFTTEKRFINYTLLNIKIITGRTHQIRVHMSAYGHPLVGDDLYGTAKTRIKNKKANLGRVFLMARKLAFKDLSGQKKEYEIGLPDDLREFLKKVK